MAATVPGLSWWATLGGFPGVRRPTSRFLHPSQPRRPTTLLEQVLAGVQPSATILTMNDMSLAIKFLTTRELELATERVSDLPLLCVAQIRFARRRPHRPISWRLSACLRSVCQSAIAPNAFDPVGLSCN